MTFKTFKHKLYQLNFTVEYLEPNEADVVSLDPNQTTGSPPFPKEFTGVNLTHSHQMFVEHNISDELFLLVKKFSDTPIKKRQIPDDFEN